VRVGICLLVLQLEDAEYATAAAVKARKAVEMELQELQHLMDMFTRSKQEVRNLYFLSWLLIAVFGFQTAFDNLVRG
jgi:thymidylate synthase ThyX